MQAVASEGNRNCVVLESETVRCGYRVVIKLSAVSANSLVYCIGEALRYDHLLQTLWLSLKEKKTTPLSLNFFPGGGDQSQQS